MLAGGIWFAAQSMIFLDNAARTEGTVIAVKRKRGAKGMALDHPVVRFVPVETGETIEFRSPVGLRPTPFAEGDPVEVAYDREDPQQAKIDSFWTIWFVPLVLALFGVACLFAGTHTVRQNNRS